MLIIKGNPFYSDYRKQQLLNKLQKHININKLSAHELFFIEGDISENNLPKLSKILSCKIIAFTESQHHFLIIAPRTGTQTPWSTKALEIIHDCNIHEVKRIERGILIEFFPIIDIKEHQHILEKILFDPLIEECFFSIESAKNLFKINTKKPLHRIPLLADGVAALEKMNQHWGLALNQIEINYLNEQFSHNLKRDPTDVEIMMFAQANSEHCRHKIFKSQWIVDGETKALSLFKMIQHTHKENPQKTLVAYADNAAVFQGETITAFFPQAETHIYQQQQQTIHTVIKVETHNHPTGISPFPGAATGVGGEIRDEAATGRGAKSIAGLCGYAVGHLRIPEYHQPWETHLTLSNRLASPLEIMLHAPIGAAAFGNEFGRPNLVGYFRNYEYIEPFSNQSMQKIYGYHKPIMLAGGTGRIVDQFVYKKPLTEDAVIIVLGGAALLIGLGGGAVSSQAAATQTTQIDFASVQRANPEMQRRAQEVINLCIGLGEKNPILSIHDVGAGGLANAIPELLHASEYGGEIDLTKIPIADPSMSPLEIWCNESQERFVLAIRQTDLEIFSRFAEREQCPFAVVGKAKKTKNLQVIDSTSSKDVINMPLNILFDNIPMKQREIFHQSQEHKPLYLQSIHLAEAIARVLKFPAVASKHFLITIADRTVGGLTARDQMVGPWQIPVADCAVTANDFVNYSGVAFAVGERPPIAMIDAAASARMSIAEAIINLASAAIADIKDIKLSANWMAACRIPEEETKLYDAVAAVALDLCPKLGISIPVGKDSLSMQAKWQDEEQNEYYSIAPLTLNISAFAAVKDIRKTITPELKKLNEKTELILIDLGGKKNRLGASILAQVYQQLGDTPPDLDNPKLLIDFFACIQALNTENLLLAYHDRSDGGLLATICEMAFASHTGVTLNLNDLGISPFEILFNEELGAVIQISYHDHHRVWEILQKYNLAMYSQMIGEPNQAEQIEFYFHHECIFKSPWRTLFSYWHEVSFHMQKLRDNPACAISENENIIKSQNKLISKTSFKIQKEIHAAYVKKNVKPKIAILRAPGVNGHVEMAAAFDHAGFTCVDVHMHDIFNNKINLEEFKGLTACGGFSYGDVLGAGRGWAMSILHHPNAYEQFAKFFERHDTFALGVCNGCQMLSELKDIIPGSELWPKFIKNHSAQFEARFAQVRIHSSPSIFFQDMQNSLLPIVVSHGEGLMHWQQPINLQQINKITTLQYTDIAGQPTEIYPYNPNGSIHGLTGLCNEDGRITILMPHPERTFRTIQCSWHPDDWEDYSPWFQMFLNARKWVD